MNKEDNNEQPDTDILQCKADILRARDVVPPYKEKPQQAKTPQTGPVPAQQEIAQRNKAGQESANPAGGRTTGADSAGVQPKPGNIPRFDLAEEIMAEQRKVTAVKRKAPSTGTDSRSDAADAERIDPSGKHPASEQTVPDEIMAEIVARDIERLCCPNTFCPEQ